MKGTVIEEIRDENFSKPHSFLIRDKDMKEYYVHLGDIETNEQLLYDNPDAIRLKVGEDVEFTPCHNNSPYYKEKAIHVKKLDS